MNAHTYWHNFLSFFSPQVHITPPSALVSKLFPALRRDREESEKQALSQMVTTSSSTPTSGPVTMKEDRSPPASSPVVQVPMNEELKQKLCQLETEIERFRGENAALERLKREKGEVSIYTNLQLYRWNESDISYLITSRAFEHSDPFKCSPGSHSQLVSCSVNITSSFSLLAFLLLDSLVLSRLRCLCSLVSQARICARLLTVATLYTSRVLKADVKSAKVKSHGNNVCDVIIGHMISGDAQTN